MPIDIDDNDFPIVRKNLNILSVIILILAFTNAKVDTSSFLGVNVELDGSKLYVALYVAYAYFIWRFCTKLPLLSGFWNDFLQFYTQRHGGKNMKRSFIKYRDRFFANSPELERLLRTDRDARLLQVTTIRFEGRGIRSIRLVANFQSSKAAPNTDNNFYATHDLTVSVSFFLRNFILFCVKYDKFGDYLFPFVPIGVNTIFFFAKGDWQGSFHKLILG